MCHGGTKQEKAFGVMIAVGIGGGYGCHGGSDVGDEGLTNLRKKRRILRENERYDILETDYRRQKYMVHTRDYQRVCSVFWK